jgi:hypothetical protein
MCKDSDPTTEPGHLTYETCVFILTVLREGSKVAMFLGYPESHSKDTYRMWNIKTKRMILSRDVLWLNKSYKVYTSDPVENVNKNDHFEAPGLDPGRVLQEEEVMDEITSEETKENEPELNARQLQEMRQLSGFFNPNASKLAESVGTRSSTRLMTSEITNPIDPIFETV